MEKHCRELEVKSEHCLLAKHTRWFSHIEGLQAEKCVFYTLWNTGRNLRLLVTEEGGPAVRCTLSADMEPHARNLLQYLYENAVMANQAADVLTDCGAAEVSALEESC